MMWHQGGYMRASEPNCQVLTPAPVDAHDQSAIVRQYMRYTAQIQSGKTVSKQILRALQMCVSSSRCPYHSQGLISTRLFHQRDI